MLPYEMAKNDKQKGPQQRSSALPNAAVPASFQSMPNGENNIATKAATYPLLNENTNAALPSYPPLIQYQPAPEYLQVPQWIPAASMYNPAIQGFPSSHGIQPHDAPPQFSGYAVAMLPPMLPPKEMGVAGVLNTAPGAESWSAMNASLQPSPQNKLPSISYHRSPLTPKGTSLLGLSHPQLYNPNFLATPPVQPPEIAMLRQQQLPQGLSWVGGTNGSPPFSPSLDKTKFSLQQQHNAAGTGTNLAPGPISWDVPPQNRPTELASVLTHAADSWMHKLDQLHPSQALETIQDGSASKLCEVKPDTKTKCFPISEDDVNRHDVLSGRGSKFNAHEGNMTFRALVSKYKKAYQCAQRSAKRKLVGKLVHFVREGRGRFLQQDKSDGMWYEIGDDKAYSKLAQLLREGSSAASLCRELASGANGNQFEQTLKNTNNCSTTSAKTTGDNKLI
ncbi:expressed unknown protein [Seminavis robusta]|uniref:DUF6824 domain-containing protein n=1 Tax=Seminavis robusta TaxID=568900 RepID=A0A9N8HGS5_9STRA|nr:expressed unknown protein [Seminavis robusta]|eukprot:Sro524_g160030.1 n/a (449) ;mRNA; r:41139-42649